MFFRIISYITFLLKSTNQHGVHSPFVYNLITKCFYDRKERASYTSIRSIYKNNTSIVSLKNAKLLNRLIPYLNFEKVLIAENPSNCIPQILSVDNTISISHSPEDNQEFDFIYLNIDDFKNNTEQLEAIFSKVHNDSLLLFHSIHTSKENQSIWQQLQNHPKITVTIDTFNFGFIFFRKEQQKEHFIIRV